MKNKILFFFCAGFFLFVTQSFSADKDSSVMKISGYVDAYYACYNDSVGAGNFQKFPSVSPRSNQFGLNTAQVTFQYDAEKVRGLAILHFGDIPVSAWSGTFNHIMEAHAGVRLCSRVWLDAGFFRTHVGTEGLLPKENFASSVSVNTYYEPYFEGGVRFNYNPNDKLAINLFVLNGYGMYEDNNDKKSIGALITYAINANGSIGYSNYTGDDSRLGDSISHTRIHQSLFFNYQIKKLKVQVGGDHCLQQHSDTTHQKTASMVSGVIGLKYQSSSTVAMYTRGEFFSDPQGFISTLFTDTKGRLTGYKLFGITGGIEYKPTDNAYIRMESRQLIMDQAQEIFTWHGEVKNNRLEFLLNMGVSF
ncbi:MAG: outer membrane beta-barrel protein [Bacteroidetes bacterium]|nr:outer membrane beta-barrel protein [Bacteroidota bacterium]